MATAAPVLVEIFKHHRWANERLVAACASIGSDALDQTSPGTYGSVRDTIVHLLAAEERFLELLGEQLDGASLREHDHSPDLDELGRRARRSGERLVQVAQRMTGARLARGGHPCCARGDVGSNSTGLFQYVVSDAITPLFRSSSFAIAKSLSVTRAEAGACLSRPSYTTPRAKAFRAIASRSSSLRAIERHLDERRYRPAPDAWRSHPRHVQRPWVETDSGLDRQVIRNVLTEFGLRPHRVRRVGHTGSAGLGNRHWHVWTLTGERYVLREHAHGRTGEDLEYEKRVVKQAMESGWPVPAPVAPPLIAAPAPMALLLGASVNAGPAMTLYYTADGEYRPSLRLPTS